MFSRTLLALRLRRLKGLFGKVSSRWETVHSSASRDVDHTFSSACKRSKDSGFEVADLVDLNRVTLKPRPAVRRFADETTLSKDYFKKCTRYDQSNPQLTDDMRLYGDFDAWDKLQSAVFPLYAVYESESGYDVVESNSFAVSSRRLLTAAHCVYARNRHFVLRSVGLCKEGIQIPLDAILRDEQRDFAVIDFTHDVFPNWLQVTEAPTGNVLVAAAYYRKFDDSQREKPLLSASTERIEQAFGKNGEVAIGVGNTKGRTEHFLRHSIPTHNGHNGCAVSHEPMTVCAIHCGGNRATLLPPQLFSVRRRIYSFFGL